MRRAALALSLLAATACSERTRIMVVVDGDLDVPGEIDGVEVHAGGVEQMSATGSLTDEPFPRTVGLAHGGGALGPIAIRAVGTLAGAPVVERVATTSFVAGRTVVLTLVLSGSCRGVTCSRGETCVEGACVSAAVDPRTLPEWGEETGSSDAGGDGADAGVDAGDAVRSCDEIYMSSAGYQLCDQRPSECEFYAELGGDSCDDVCGAAGGTCVETYADGNPDDCERAGGPRSCSDTHRNEICVCTRIP